MMPNDTRIYTYTAHQRPIDDEQTIELVAIKLNCKLIKNSDTIENIYHFLSHYVPNRAQIFFSR